jgi:hypothetical protein
LKLRRGGRSESEEVISGASRTGRASNDTKSDLSRIHIRRNPKGVDIIAGKEPIVSQGRIYQIMLNNIFGQVPPGHLVESAAVRETISCWGPVVNHDPTKFPKLSSAQRRNPFMLVEVE